MRHLSNNFLDDLANKNGFLHPILNRIKSDHTLMLAIRNDYINIYYRGGNMMKIEASKTKTNYKPIFNQEYCTKETPPPNDLPSTLCDTNDVKLWVKAIPYLKEVMDFYFANIKNKPEREFQQLVARENNLSSISNETEYFILDIEYSDIGVRFDMLALRWLASSRKNGRNCRAALIEMKYGDNALTGTAGIIKHLDDINDFLQKENNFQSLREKMTTQFNQLDRLGLLQFNPSTNGTRPVLSDDKPEVIILLANHNPRSSILKQILHDPKIEEYANSQLFDLRFFVACFSGYGMHSKCMLSLSDFRMI